LRIKPKHYQSSDIIYRPADGAAYQLPKNLVGSYADPSLWAYSTLPPGDYDDLVNIYVVNQNSRRSGETARQRMWLHDILDDEGIPYQVVIMGYWAARRKYAEDQFIYVEEKHELKTKRLIKAFNDSDHVSGDFSDEETSPKNYVDGILQKKCTSCGKEIDFDYHKCPYCKALQ